MMHGGEEEEEEEWLLYINPPFPLVSLARSLAKKQAPTGYSSTTHGTCNVHRTTLRLGGQIIINSVQKEDLDSSWNACALACD